MRMLGSWFGTSKGREGIHREMEKHMSGKQMFAEPAETMGHRVDRDLQALLFPHHGWPISRADISGEERGPRNSSSV